MNGNTATLEDFLDVQYLDYFPKMMKTIWNFLQQNGIQKPLWLGETSSAYGSGAKGISDRYVAGFLWLDKLGMAAYYNYQVIIRQTFYNGCYAIIGHDLYPNPDFWISALYKTLVSPKVCSTADYRGDFPIRSSTYVCMYTYLLGSTNYEKRI